METIAAPGAGVTADELAAIEARSAPPSPPTSPISSASSTSTAAATRPTGVEEVGAFVAGFLADLGAEVVDATPIRTAGSGPTIVGTVRGAAGAGPRLLLIGHMDTVFDPGTAAERPFRIEDGTAYGPGVTDMKSGLLTGLYALRALIELTRAAACRSSG